MLAALIRFRTQDKIPIHLCAEKIGISIRPCRLKAKELGLNAPVYLGPRGPRLTREEINKRRRERYRDNKR